MCTFNYGEGRDTCHGCDGRVRGDGEGEEEDWRGERERERMCGNKNRNEQVPVMFG